MMWSAGGYGPSTLAMTTMAGPAWRELPNLLRTQASVSSAMDARIEVKVQFKVQLPMGKQV